MASFIIFAFIAAVALFFYIKSRKTESKALKKLKRALDKVLVHLHIIDKKDSDDTVELKGTVTNNITHSPDVLIMDVFEIQRTDAGEKKLVTKYSEKIDLKENEMCCICREGEKTDDDKNIKLIYLQEYEAPQWKTVSKRHLYITKINADYVMQDEYSTYRTFICENGSKTVIPHKQSVVIKDKMILVLGAQYIGFRILVPDELLNIEYPTGPSETETNSSDSSAFEYPDVSTPSKAEETPEEEPKKMFAVSFK